MKLKKTFLIALFPALFLSSCADEDTPIDTHLGDYDNGILILNQGNFGQNNSTISYLSNDFETFQASAFNAVNPTLALGDTAQDLGFYEENAFVVLNNSDKIEIINRYTLASVATISEGLNNPRFIAFSNSKIFVTNWSDGMNPNDDFVAVYSLADFSWLTSIPVVEGPERIVAHDSKLYVAHKGGFNFNNQISVLNAASNQVQTTLQVGDVPESMVVHNQLLYVLSSGLPAWSGTETAGNLKVINLSNLTENATFTFATNEHPNHLKIANNQLFYTLDAEVFATQLNFNALPTTSLIEMNPQGVYGIYGFEVHNNQIFVADAADFNSNGKIYVYNLTGQLLHERTVGVIPTGFYFN
jgi:hypothetical protein